MRHRTKLPPLKGPLTSRVPRRCKIHPHHPCSSAHNPPPSPPPPPPPPGAHILASHSSLNQAHHLLILDLAISLLPFPIRTLTLIPTLPPHPPHHLHSSSHPPPASNPYPSPTTTAQPRSSVRLRVASSPNWMGCYGRCIRRGRPMPRERRDGMAVEGKVELE